MPGFNVSGSGGNGPSNVLEVRRKYRWSFTTIGRGQGQFSAAELLMLQSASRPSFEFEEPEMHHVQEHAYFAGKQKWEPITLVWYDVEQDPDISAGLYAWIETVVNLTEVNVAHPSMYKRTSTLQMEDGFGSPTEVWTLYGTWPKSCNWQELDYTSTDLQTCEATMRFDRSIKSCGNQSGRRATVPSC